MFILLGFCSMVFFLAFSTILRIMGPVLDSSPVDDDKWYRIFGISCLVILVSLVAGGEILKAISSGRPGEFIFVVCAIFFGAVAGVLVGLDTKGKLRAWVAKK